MYYFVIFLSILMPLSAFFNLGCEESKPLQILKKENSEYRKYFQKIEDNTQKLLLCQNTSKKLQKEIINLNLTISNYETSIAKDKKTTTDSSSSYQSVLSNKERIIKKQKDTIQRYETLISQLEEKLQKNTTLQETIQSLEKKLSTLEKSIKPIEKNIPSNGFAKVVRGERSYSTIKGKPSIIKDNLRGLLWERKNDSNQEDKKTHDEAIEYCKNLELDGIKGWKLPTMEELYYLADRSKRNPAIDTNYFRNTKSDWYWTSTKQKDLSNSFWVVGFSYGDDYWDDDSYFVRCVRQ